MTARGLQRLFMPHDCNSVCDGNDATAKHRSAADVPWKLFGDTVSAVRHTATQYPRGSDTPRPGQMGPGFAKLSMAFESDQSALNTHLFQHQREQIYEV